MYSWVFLLALIVSVGYCKISQHQIFKKHDRINQLIKSGEWKELHSKRVANETLYDWYDDFYK